MSYLQFKSTADKLSHAHDAVTPENLYHMLREISTEEEVREYFKRWSNEKNIDGQPIKSEQSRTEELEKALSVTRATLESTADAILIIDKNGKLTDFNQKFLEVTEVPIEIIESGEENAGLGYLLGLLKNPQDLVQQMQYLMMHPEEIGDMGEVHFKNGKIVERYSQPHRIGDQIVGRVWSFRDVTEKRKQEEMLRLTNRAIVSSTHGIILIENNKKHNITYANPASLKLLNLTESDVTQKSFFSILPEFEQHQAHIEKMFFGRKKDELRIRCKIQNKTMWLEINIDPVHEKNQKDISHFVCIINDVTKNKELENILHYKALHDTLTGLPNKSYMEDAIRYRIKKAGSQKESFGLLFIDIDRFKNINDTLGHRIGDKVLCLFSKRLEGALQKKDVVARIGGDEFIVLIDNTLSVDTLNTMAKHILESSRKRFTHSEHEFNISVSIGVVHYPDCGNDPETLIRNADIAMYQAKQAGRNRLCAYTTSLNNTVSRRVQIENELHDAVKKNEFELHYQPIYDITKKKFLKAEALMRWKNSSLGQVSPAEFIPVAEDIGMMTTVGRWIIETGTKQLKAWEKIGLNDITLSLNVSAKQLLDENFVRDLTRVLYHNKLVPEKIILEITESFLLLEEKVSGKLNELNKMNVKISIDDFGKGYSNLNYLHKLNISHLKIDKTFVDQIDQKHFNDSVLLTIIAIGKRMGYGIVAEGVETESQLEFLTKNGCDEIQGYYFSKPFPTN